MQIPRLIQVSILILAMTVAAWAAKKQQNSPTLQRSAVQAPVKSNAPAKTSASSTVPVTTKVDAPTDQTRDALAPQQQAGAAVAYQIPWQTVNGGGAPMTSTSYRVNASVGQSSIGFAASTNYEAGVGYWYGAAATGGGCSCPHQCDYDDDNFLTALDLGSLIDVLFAGKPEVTDPDCPTSRGDFDCDNFPTALDMGKLIDHLFAGGPPPCDPCSP